MANSVDLTRDYWERGEYPCLYLGLKSGDAAKLGEVTAPYLASTKALLVESGYSRRGNRLSLVLGAFPGHSNETRIVSPLRPVSVMHNG